MKTLLVFFFICLISIIAGRYVFFSLVQLSKKSEFRAQAFVDKHKNMQVIHLPLAYLFKDLKAVVWKDHNKEVVINGRYFEVEKITIKNKIASIFLVEDEKETSLVHQFQEFEKKSKKDTERLQLPQLELVFLAWPQTLFALSQPTAQEYHPGCTYHLAEGITTELLQPPASH